MVERGPKLKHMGYYQRTITVEALYQNDITGTRIVNENVLVPDDSVVRYRVQPMEEDYRITVRVGHRCCAGRTLLLCG